MKNLKVVEQVPQGFSPGYDPWLYNSREYLNANNELPQLHFYLVDETEKVLLGHIAFSREESEVLSPYKSPFGGFELAAAVTSEAFLFFVTELIGRLRIHHVRFVSLKLPPPFYQNSHNYQTEDLLALGFDQKKEWRYHAVAVDEQNLVGKMVTMEQRELRKARKMGLQFRMLDRQGYAAAYDFITIHRESKGHALSMTWPDLREAIKAKPESYRCCGVYLEEKLLAACMLIRVNRRVIYYFQPAHDPEFNAQSPMVFLLDALYEWCRQEEIAFIDLGTSYLPTGPNESLVKFKEHVGGQAYMSPVFRKALSL